MTTRTIRARLAINFGVAFTVAGFLLLALNYTLIERQFDTRNPFNMSERLEELRSTFDPAVLRELPDPFDPAARSLIADQIATVDGRTFAEVLADVESSVRAETLNTLLVQGAIAVVAMGAVAVAVGWWLSSRALRPVAEITATARMLSDDDLSARVALNGPPDEVKELADTFDAMLDRLERGYTQHRNFAAVASHELRTPLAVMRIEADNALDDPETTEDHRNMARRVLAAVSKSERMIEQLMALTRAGTGLTNVTEIDLADLTGEATGELSGSAAAAGIRLDLSLDDATVDGDRTLLSVLVTNLIDNAIVHNVGGGWGKIQVDVDGGNARLRVTNSGRSYSSDDVARMLQPFERIANQGTRGSGLGLATAGAIVDAHRGQMHAEPLDGGGLSVTVLLPSPSGRPAPRRPTT